jgi:polyhydroxyalkanoate depolymerase
MIYQNYQFMANLSDPLRLFADGASCVLKSWNASSDLNPIRKMAAYYEQVSLLGMTHKCPPFNIEPVTSLNAEIYPVIETVITSTDFCTLRRFKKDLSTELPKILLVAPMSGHFATLLRGTVQTLVLDHDVYLTDWLNIRDIPYKAGKFGLDEYIETIITFLKYLGPGIHLMGVCQPTVACLAATALLAEDKDECVPASLTLMAGPIDARINPTQVNELAMSKPIQWFKQNLIGVVPLQFPGSGRAVYPGFLQLMAFLNMNLERHKKSLADMMEHRINGDDERADLIKEFYQEYFAIMDLSADFYLETVENVFQKHLLPKGELYFKGRLIKPESIRKTFLLTVEGERDDICGIGQTLAAQDLCSKIPPYMKTHHLQAGVGHYGVFNGKKWSNQIYPVIRSMVHSTI